MYSVYLLICFRSTYVSHSPVRVEGPFLESAVTHVSCGWKHTAAISGIFWGGKENFISIFIMQVIRLISESFLQITKFLHGAGEVLTAHSLLMGTPPVDNWFVLSSLLSIKYPKQLAYTNATSFYLLVHFVTII